MILNEILDELSYELKRRKVVNVCVGTSYTGVLLDDQSLGISITLTDGEVEEAGELQGKYAFDVANNFDSPMRRSISMAVMNALTPDDVKRGDPLQLFQGGRLCMFGYSPQVKVEGFSEVVSYDFSPEPVQGSRPFSDFRSEICSTAVIFGSSLVLNNIEKILKNLKAEHLIMNGASSVMAPNTLKRYGFEAVGKLVPLDRNRAFRTICEGGNARQLARYLDRVHLILT
ncbi:Rossmann-like domain-containing protein [Metallosphaera hakonensis]|uniref:Heavy-metal chelation domain-containing protein n=1 Tax=Metallosphaera hakonensis JCM 8857 = DSM 7519 TaxID=1293036 RepID=A0A2U9IUR2_9CREN|nr:DUF364 domain-containing protein [Metallosphaera hakonensis]AWR99820.1 hypothetical protein DFR87_09075 [Metallosphaera hakonensis JCM 8857 = DSM 7519]